jgi:hypothetical protein
MSNARPSARDESRSRFTTCGQMQEPARSVHALVLRNEPIERGPIPRDVPAQLPILPHLPHPTPQPVGDVPLPDRGEMREHPVQLRTRPNADQRHFTPVQLHAHRVSTITRVEALRETDVRIQTKVCARLSCVSEQPLVRIGARSTSRVPPAPPTDGEAQVRDGHRSEVRWRPPSIKIVSPVIHPARPLNRKVTRLATSTGVPTRPSGCVCWPRSKKAA